MPWCALPSVEGSVSKRAALAAVITLRHHTLGMPHSSVPFDGSKPEKRLTAVKGFLNSVFFSVLKKNKITYHGGRNIPAISTAKWT
jgi:hypothetical protein